MVCTRTIHYTILVTSSVCVTYNFEALPLQGSVDGSEYAVLGSTAGDNIAQGIACQKEGECCTRGCANQHRQRAHQNTNCATSMGQGAVAERVSKAPCVVGLMTEHPSANGLPRLPPCPKA